LPNFGCAVFVARSLGQAAAGLSGLRVVEVGARGLYGGYRAIADLHGGVSEYVGVDIAAGPGVDVVCDAGELVNRFGPGSFDVVIATELIEHVRDYRTVISQLKGVCRPGGIVILTTRSRGYAYHAAPFDFWRFETDDMERMFSDCEILLLEEDQEEPGVFLSARKPQDFIENDLAAYELFSILHGRRVADLDLAGLGRARLLLMTARAKFWQLGRWFFTGGERDYPGMIRRQAGELKGLLSLARRK
jgi:SAM-dependent methyltransferase